AGDGDIVVPQRNLTIIGSTQWLSDNPDINIVPPEDIDFLNKSAIDIFPCFKHLEYHTAWAAARPLFGKHNSLEGVRNLSRDFAIIDHKVNDNIDNMISIVGGKATTLRAMGEVATNMICKKLGLENKCETANIILPNYREYYRGGYHG
ncbi:MAG: FAD-dependent oxidoreductase, partial [Sphaerochaetaceae bacterium]